MVKVVSEKAEFDELVSGNKLVVVDFFAEWCGPCKRIAPELEEMSKTETDVLFLKVDVDESEDIAAENEISAMPTFIIFKDGKRAETIVGANMPKLRETIAKLK